MKKINFKLVSLCFVLVFMAMYLVGCGKANPLPLAKIIAYVTNSASNTVSVINTINHTVIKPITVENQLMAITFGLVR